MMQTKDVVIGKYGKGFINSRSFHILEGEGDKIVGIPSSPHFWRWVPLSIID